MTSCVFSYYISESDLVIEELSARRLFGKYKVLMDSRTPFNFAHFDNRECAFIGFAINVLTNESENLAQTIVSSCLNIYDLIEFEKFLGGKYLILFRNGDEYFVLGDATCSVPIYYFTAGSSVITSNPHYLVTQYNCFPDAQLQRIRECGEISQAMPFDITPYREIKQLIPNHYLNVDRSKAERFVNSSQPQKAISARKAAELTAPMIKRICKYYSERFRIYCPITSGRDSRVVLAFLSKESSLEKCYTIRHAEHQIDSQDVVIPKHICEENKFSYEQIGDTNIQEEQIKLFDHLLGKNQYSRRTLQIAQTIKEHYGDGAIINGDIIGQVGKCSLHRDIPILFATPSYFLCKLHNYSLDAKKHLKMWMDDIKRSSECVNIFDLFSIENRMGRWAGQENLVYNIIGQEYLNIFNSRSIIYLWTAVSRKERKKSKIHINLIKGEMDSLLKLPFENDESVLIRFSKVNGFSYLLSSYAKYYFERIEFLRGKKK